MADGSGDETTLISSHYQSVRKTYEAALFYSPGPYNNWLCSVVLAALNLRPGHCTLADVGGGTGMFTAMLKSSIGAGTFVVVEPSESMISGAQKHVDHAICADAEAWALGNVDGGQCPVHFDRVLVKEVVHHLGDGNARERIFRALRTNRLLPGGTITIVTRPQRDIDYPFFAAAREVWASHQPDHNDLCGELVRAGFTDVHVEHCRYPCELPLTRWCALVAGRVWSTFHVFSDAELDAGCEAIRQDQGDVSIVRFEDRIILISAVNPHVMADCMADTSGDGSSVTQKEKVPPPPSPPPAPPPLAAAAAAPLPVGLRYARDGYVSPVDVLSRSEASEALANLEALATEGKLSGDARFKLHLLFRWASRLVRHPSLLAAVCGALGTDDVLVWSTDVNAKEAHSNTHSSPHQDATYANLVPADGALTAWVALSDAPVESGCLCFASGSHLLGQLEHVTDAPAGAAVADNLLAFGQTILGYGNGDGVVAPLRAGQASLHSFRTVHWSPPNRTPHRRVGLAIRYVSATVTRDASRLKAREMVTLVSGEYDPAAGAFDLEPPPQTDGGEEERRVHAEAMQRERLNYFSGAADTGQAAYK